MNYYNEFDPAAATWLRELIAAKLIPQGEVDTRSIKDVKADELRGYTQCHFFAGIGGWSRALQLAGWPEDRPVWSGSCPCQCFSLAGKGKGAEDERDLWSVFFELIKACRPEFVFGEQVEAAIKHGWLDRVCANMETEDYTVGAVVLGAHSVSAPHLRQRLYWGAVANSTSFGSVRESGNISKETRRQKIGYSEQSIISSGISSNLELAEDSASIRCRGRNNADSAGLEREIQAQGLRDDGGIYNTYRPRLYGKHVSDERGQKESTVTGRCAVDQLGNLSRQSGDSVLEIGRETFEAGRSDSAFSMGNSSLSTKARQSELNEYLSMPSGCVSSLSSRSDCGLVYCRDNKIRRVPAESLFFGVADGISEGMDEGRNCGVLEVERGFPLCKKEEEIGRTMLLKGYSNAIVPQVAAEFIKAFKEEAK